MAQKKNQPAPTTPPAPDAKQQLADAGVPAEHHDEVLAVQAPAQAAGLNVADLAALVKEFGPDAVKIGRRIFDLIKKRRGGGG